MTFPSPETFGEFMSVEAEAAVIVVGSLQCVAHKKFNMVETFNGDLFQRLLRSG